MMGKLIQKKQFPFSHNNLFAIYNIRKSSLAYVEYFHIIMAVKGKMNKPGMGADCDQLSFLQHLIAVNGKIASRRVKIPVHFCVSVQDPSLFFCNFTKLLQEFSLHCTYLLLHDFCFSNYIHKKKLVSKPLFTLTSSAIFNLYFFFFRTLVASGCIISSAAP